MIGKQLIIDISLVVALPVLIIGGYYLWGPTSDSLSLAPSAALGVAEPGYKTKLALDTLSSITLDDSLFADPAYLSLKSFTVVIPEVPLARSYPFTPPPIIEERLRQARLGHVVNTTPVATTDSLSSQIDKLKKTSK
jgi:hypothetical protein